MDNNKDPYLNLKKISYNWAVLPNTYSFHDLVKFAKFQLAAKLKVLVKDPIWDEYTNEEILTEYFAHSFLENEKFKEQFEIAVGLKLADIDEFATWADNQMSKEDKIIKETFEDSISFDPSDILGE